MYVEPDVLQVHFQLSNDDGPLVNRRKSYCEQLR